MQKRRQVTSAVGDINCEDGIVAQGSISVDCTEDQEKWLVENIDHIEAFPTDADRIRFVFVDGSFGKWFSRRWDRISYTQVVK